MLIDTTVTDTGETLSVQALAAQVKQAEACGVDGVWATEIQHDPFLLCSIAAANSSTVTVGTAIAVAFARSPMTVAVSAFDLQCLSRGRFILGLGSQIKPHIERRFSMPWSAPAARMREYLHALAAIWTSWETGDALDFRGEFYQHTLMIPMFSPGANPFGRPKVIVAAVGEQMTRVAAEASDGLLVHSFSTDRYLREATLPVIEDGLRGRGLSRSDFQISLPAFVATGRTSEELRAASRAVCKQIAFYGSTPAYAPVLQLHGWADLHVQLNAMSKRGEWDQMTGLIDDEVLNAFAVVGEPSTIGPRLLQRYTDLVDRVTLYTPTRLDAELHTQIAADLTAGRSRSARASYQGLPPLAKIASGANSAAR
jgi:probable F420-dependent oxidoreductase